MQQETESGTRTAADIFRGISRRVDVHFVRKRLDLHRTPQLQGTSRSQTKSDTSSGSRTPSTNQNVADKSPQFIWNKDNISIWSPHTPLNVRQKAAEEIAFSLLKQTRPQKSRHPKTLQANKNRAIKKLISEAQKCHGERKEELMAASLMFKAGQEAFPRLAALTKSSATEDAVLARNCSSILKDAGRHDGPVLLKRLSKGLPRSFILEKLDTNKNTLEYSQRLPTKESLGGNYARNVTREKVISDAGRCFKSFYFDTTHVESGAETSLRNMEMQKHEWHAELHARWPSLLRRCCKEELPRQDWAKLTHFQCGRLKANKDSEEDSFDESVEIEQRRKEYMQRYYDSLARKNGQMQPEDPEVVLKRQEVRADEATRMTIGSFDHTRYTYRVPALETFTRYLKSQGLTYTSYASPHPCHLCDKGPVNMAALENMKKQRIESTEKGMMFSSEKISRMVLLNKKVQEYLLHKDQLKHCREYTKKITAGLKVGEVAVVRDYVNHHDHSGAHVKCLHYVLQWREKEGGELQLLKIRTYCSDPKSCSTDSYYTVDCMDLHLKKGGYFDKFSRIYFFGDHGPHFTSANVLWKEAQAYRTHGKEVHCIFYCSYHAYGRCDAAGAEDKKAARRDLCLGTQRVGAQAYTQMTNESNDKKSVAYTLDQINRSDDVFPKQKELSKITWMRKWCEIKYEFEGRDESTEGISIYLFFSCSNLNSF